MEKQTAINLLGGTPMKAAKAMGYKSVHAVYLWPDVLSPAVADRVNGALSRINLDSQPACLRSAKTPEEVLKLADGLELVDRRVAQLPFAGPDRRLAGQRSTDIGIIGQGA